MGDHEILCVDRTVQPAKAGGQAVAAVASATSGGCCDAGGVEDVAVGREDEEEPLVGAAECRICQEDDCVKNLDAPCSCDGSLKYAHKACLQRWVDARGDLTCEICHEPYKTGHYVLPRAHLDETVIDFSGGWAIPDTHLDWHDPWFFSSTASQRHFVETEYGDHDNVYSGGTAYFRSASLVFMALLLIRHALLVYEGDGSEQAADVLLIFMLRAAVLLLPCFAMTWLVGSMLRRRQREEAAALSANEIAFMLQTAQPRSLHFSIAPQSPVTPRQEPE